jgi:hypothetical protein
MPDPATPAAPATPKAAEATPPTPTEPATPPAQPAPGGDPATPAAAAPDATKPATAQPAAQPAVPEKYELKLPEGSLLSAEHVTALETQAKNLGLSNVQAQAMIDRESNLLAVHQDRQVAEFKAKSAQWVEDVKTDKELGGAQVKENVELSHRALEKFADPEFVKMLDDTGLGNHPGLLKTFHRIAKAMKEDSVIIPRGQGAGAKPLAQDILYGQNKNQ